MNETKPSKGISSDNSYSGSISQTPQQDSSTQRSDKQYQQHQQQYNQQDAFVYIEHLKRGYCERLEQYQMMISDACIQLENDEMINAVKDDRDMETFRLKRFQEIVGEQLRIEQEMKIDKMIEENAMLHLNVRRAEEQRDNLKLELTAITERVLEFEQRVQQELAQKDMLQADLEDMKSNEIANRENYDRYLKMKEQSYSQSEAMFKTELQNSRFEIENLRKEKTELVFESEQLKEQTTVLSNNIEILILKLQARQENDRQADARTDELKLQIQRLTQSINESNKEKEIMAEKIMQQIQEIQAIKNQIEEISKENDLLASNTENLKIKAAKTESLISEKTIDLTKKLEKVKLKKKDLKQQFQAIKQKLDHGNREQDHQKRIALDSIEEYERTIAKMKSDMLTIRNEWEKRCQSIELSSQAQLLEGKAKQEATISRIQAEYQNLLEKKVNEMEEQTKQIEMAQSKGVSMLRLERDYISKQQHAQILEEEIDALQQRHSETMNQIVQKHHANISDKIKEISDRKAKEYDILSSSIQANCMDLQNALSDQIKITQEQKEKLLELENSQYKVKEINHFNSSEIKELRQSIDERDLRIKEKEVALVNLSDQLKKQEFNCQSLQAQLKQQSESLSRSQETVERLHHELAGLEEQSQITQGELLKEQQKTEEQLELNQSLSRQLETIKLKQSSEKDSALRTVQFQETLKLDKEREDHEETRRKFEKKQRALEKELSTLKDESQETIIEQSEQLKRVTSYKDRIENEKKVIQVELISLQGRFEKNRQDSFRLIKRLALQLTSLGKDVDELRSDVSTDISALQSVSIQSMKNLLSKAKELKEREVLEMNQRLVEEKQEINLNCDEKIESVQSQHSEFVQKLKANIEELSLEIQEVSAELESEKKQVAQLSKQNAKLDSIIQKNSEDMQQHNEELSGQMSRIKEEQMNLMRLQLESTSVAFKQEIDQLNKTIKQYEETLSLHKSEIQKIETELQSTKTELEQVSIEGEKKDEMIERLREQLLEVSQAYENIQEENNEAFEIVEGKLAEYKKAITSEADKYRIVKESSNLEIKQLHEEMNMLRHHLSLKGNSIDTMAKYHELSAYSKANQQQNQYHGNSYISNAAQPLISSSFSSTARQQPLVPPMINTSGLPRTLKHNNSHSNLPTATTPVHINSSREKSHAKKSNGGQDRSFDASRLDALTEMSRQHKMKVQQMISPTIPAPNLASTPLAAGISQIPTKDNKHDSPGILYEIKHLLAQSYDLVNKTGHTSVNPNNNQTHHSTNPFLGGTGVDYSKKNHLRISHRSSTTVGDIDIDEEQNSRNSKNSQFVFQRVPRSVKNENTQSKSPTPTMSQRHVFNFSENYPEVEKPRTRFDSSNY